jgi:hypothetical protein
MKTANEVEAYNKREISQVVRAFKAMDEEGQKEAKEIGFQLAEFALGEIRATARTRYVAAEGVRRVADGAKASKTSKIGEMSFGFAGQKFSGGGTTQLLWPGLEFGSNRFAQFPSRTPQKGRGNAGYFIYPTLRRLQPQLVRKWEDSFSKIVSKY